MLQDNIKSARNLSDLRIIAQLRYERGYAVSFSRNERPSFPANLTKKLINSLRECAILRASAQLTHLREKKLSLR